MKNKVMKDKDKVMKILFVAMIGNVLQQVAKPIYEKAEKFSRLTQEEADALIKNDMRYKKHVRCWARMMPQAITAGPSLLHGGKLGYMYCSFPPGNVPVPYNEELEDIRIAREVQAKKRKEAEAKDQEKRDQLRRNAREAAIQKVANVLRLLDPSLSYAESRQKAEERLREVTEANAQIDFEISKRLAQIGSLEAELKKCNSMLRLLLRRQREISGVADGLVLLDPSLPQPDALSQAETLLHPTGINGMPVATQIADCENQIAEAATLIARLKREIEALNRRRIAI